MEDNFLDIQKILTCVVSKVDSVNSRSVAFDPTSSSIVNTTSNQITLTNHGLVANQRVVYDAGGDRFLDARDLVISNIDYIVEETIGWLEATYPSLTNGQLPDYDRSVCARDTRLVIAAWANDLRYGGNAFTVAAANSYIGTTVLVADRYGDARNLLRANKEFIAEEAVGRMLADPVTLRLLFQVEVRIVLMTLLILLRSLHTTLPMVATARFMTLLISM